jgi:two-component system, sensor histidine kinase and response regulator
MTHILIIEDEIEIRENIAEILSFSGYDVSSVANGEDGIIAAQTRQPDLIVCDIMMPGINGFEVLMRLRNDKSTMLIPFIFLTAITENRSVRHGMQLGADDFITKPFTPDDLTQAIEIRLQKQREANEKYQAQIAQLRQNIVHALPHEIRTPLSGILGCAQMILENVTSSPDDIGSLTEIILKSANRLQHLTENYLIWSQMEVFSQEPEHLANLRSHSLNYPDTVLEDIGIQLCEHYQRIPDLKIDVEPGIIHMQHDNWYKIVWELIDNAFKFSASGTPVHIQSRQLDGHYHVVISDQGRGMSAEEIKLIGIYNQFKRNIYEQQGLGMGLAIAKKMVTLHEGRFQLNSVPDERTEITLTLI